MWVCSCWKSLSAEHVSNRFTLLRWKDGHMWIYAYLVKFNGWTIVGTQCVPLFAGLGYWLVHVCLCTLKGRPVETGQKVAQLREHNNKSNKYKLPVGRRPPEPASTAATTETRTNVKIRKLCSPDMLSDSRTAPRFCIRINKLPIVTLLINGKSTLQT